MSKLGFVGFVLLSAGWMVTASGETYTPGQKVDKDFRSFAQPFLVSHCVDCHGDTEPEGDLSLSELGPVDEINAGIWKSVWAAMKENLL